MWAKAPLSRNSGRTQVQVIYSHRFPHVCRATFATSSKTSVMTLTHFFMLLSAYYRKRLYERESLIIFDEVQRYPAARSSSNIWLRMAGMTMWKLVR